MAAFDTLRRRVALGLLLAATTARAVPAADGLVASWAVHIDGDDTQRTLRIVGIEPAELGAARVFALLGPRGQRLGPVAVELGEDHAVTTMRLTTATGARFDMRRSHDGAFVGQVTAASGAVRPVRFSRMGPGEDTGTAGAHYIVRPGADVPADCAGYSGLWQGDWVYGARGRAWIWVLEVDADCQAKVAMLRELKRPAGFRVVQIRAGVAELPNANGSDVFRLVGGELRAVASRHHDNTNNNALFKRIPDTLP